MKVKCTQEGILLESYQLARLIRKISRPFSIEELELRSLLMAGEAGRSAASYARTTGDLLRPSRPIAESPHAALLREYLAHGANVFAPDQLEATAYYQNAAKCIELFGHYFSARHPKGIVNRARKFCEMFEGRPCQDREDGESPPGSLPVVRRIRFSECYEIVHGQHRLAMAAVKGLKKYRCMIEASEPALTPLQQMIMDSSWTNGRRELYQPVGAPELETWPVVRKCTDRLSMMTNWLAASGIPTGSYLDIGCSYGWFVAEMAKRGFEASGVDRDAAALVVGRAVYGLHDSALRASDIVKFLEEPKRQHDVVSCFSVLHHFVLGKMHLSPAEFIRRVDAVTGKALFVDTAECHEGWFSKQLASWNAEYIGQWLKEHTTFTCIEILGKDSDNVGSYRDQYQRHLFVCSRK